MQSYKGDKEWDVLPNDDDTVHKEDDNKGYESENCGELWKNYKDDKHILNKELELVLQNCFEENTEICFSYALSMWYNS